MLLDICAASDSVDGFVENGVTGKHMSVRKQWTVKSHVGHISQTFVVSSGVGKTAL